MKAPAQIQTIQNIILTTDEIARSCQPRTEEKKNYEVEGSVHRLTQHTATATAAAWSVVQALTVVLFAFFSLIRTKFLRERTKLQIVCNQINHFIIDL